MRKALILLSIPVIILALASCSVSPTVNIGTPTNLKWDSSGSNGLDLTLLWDCVADVDGYKIITPADDTVDVDTIACFHIFTDAPVGTYSVYAYKGSENGAAATISNAPYVETTALTIYPLSSLTGYSGFDITTYNGIAHMVSMADSTNAATVDFYLDDDMYFVSADEYLSFTCDNKTRFLDNGTNEIVECDEYIPGTNYYNKEKAISGHNYMVSFCETDQTGPYYYGIIKDVIVTADNVSFTYEFQPLNGFRKF